MKNILITGISRGLGLDLAYQFLEEGWTVWGISRSKTSDLEVMLRKFPGKLKYKQFDLMDVENIQEVIFKEFINLQTPLHAFINNAAIAYDDIITNLKIEPLEKMFKINVYSPMLITKYIIRNMILHHIQGSIIHISSISVHTGYKGLAMYASTKGALEAFSKNTAREWGKKEIRSNCIVAGFMDTNMSSTLSAEQRQRIYNRTSLKKETSKYSIAATAVFLASKKSISITGQNIHVDSGTI